MNPVALTPEQKTAVEIARVGFMAACPFFCHYFYAEMREVYTLDVPTAATDGRNIFINPEYIAGLKPPERVFVFAHEVYHVIMRHPQRMAHYSREGECGGKPWDAGQFNKAADYVINADLLEQGVGMCNPSWLYDPKVTGADLSEDIYARKYQKPPPGQGQGQGGQSGSTYGQSGKGPKGAKGDGKADAQGGSFDSVLPPSIDPVTGKEDVPDPAEFKEAVARAAAAAKAMGNMPANFKRLVDEILEPEVDWKDKIRMVLTGRIGSRGETWDRPNRRRLALNPMIILPGRKGFGAGTVVVGVDTSGSIGEKELAAFFAEVGGILNDVRPKRVVLIACDAHVQQVDEAASLDELQVVRQKGLKGGGGTRFEPVFDRVEKDRMNPDALVFFTDLLGTFPKQAPAYPTVWCSTSKGIPAPFGDLVEIHL
jgi:predicted metal-dependent peptidase